MNYTKNKMKRKRKLKNEEVLLDDLYRPAHNISDKLFLVGMAVAVLILGITGLDRLADSIHSRTSSITWVTPQSRALAQPTQPPAQVAPVKLDYPRARDARLVLSNAQGEILHSKDGVWFIPMRLNGQSVTARNGALAFVSGSTLYIRRDEVTQPVDFAHLTAPRGISMPAWSPDGAALAVIAHAVDGDRVYRVDADRLHSTLLLEAPHIAAPPIFNPATGRILIAEQTGIRQTTLYTLSPHCTNPDSCRSTRRDLAVLNQRLDWADYHPNATALVFSDADDGDLYLLATATGEVSPLLSDSLFKRRPAFSPDGRRLAYLGGDQRVYILRLEDMTIQVVEQGSVTSVDWME